MEQNRIDRGVNLLVQVLNKERLSVVDAVSDGTQPVV